MESIALVMLLAAPQDLALPDRIDRSMGSISGYERGIAAGDDVFLKRVMADLTGQTPTDEIIKAFVTNPIENKRAKLVDERLASDAFAEFWAKRLTDVFLGSPATIEMELAPELKTRIVKNFTRWLRDQLKNDRPYNEIVHEMLAATGKTEEAPALAYKLSFHRGAGYGIEMAAGTVRQLIGVRLQCARCHDHPFEKFTIENYYGVAAFGARAKATPYATGVEIREAAEGEITNPDNGKTAMPTWLIGGVARKFDDRSTALATFMTAKNNTYLARLLANRVWAWLFGRGVVEPVDDFNDQTWKRSPSPVLLEAMTKGFMENTYSIKQLLRAICATEVYQREDVAGRSWRGATRLDAFNFRGLTFVPHPAWQPQPEQSALGRYRVLDKQGRAREAELTIRQEDYAKAKHRSGQVSGAKSEVSTHEGKHEVTLYSTSGTWMCDPNSVTTGPSRDRLLIGMVKIEKSIWSFRLGGPAETVDDWREEFIEMLKGVSQK